jgi:hypothetical protein
LKKNFINEAFSLLLSSLTDQQVAEAHVYIKKVIQTASGEDGEIINDQEQEQSINMSGRAFYQQVDRQSKVREVLDGTVVFEYPTFYVVL